MELARVQLARSIWLFDTAELNPRGVNIFPQVFINFISRYHFRKAPKAEEYLTPDKRKFEEGEFFYQGLTLDVSVELWADGLIADTRHSTDATDDFLADIVEWMGAEIGVNYPEGMTSKKIYRSELVVYPDFVLADACDKFAKIAGLVQDFSGEHTELSSFEFGCESQAKRTFFTFQRRTNEPFEGNKFFSAALLKTSEHLDLLQKVEDTLLTAI